MDSLQRYEMSHTDALRPVQREAATSFMGEHSLTQPATCNDLQQFMSWVIGAINMSLSTHPALASQRPVASEQAPAPLPASEPASQNAPCSNTSAVATSTAASPPFANVRIPDIPRGPDNWRKAVEQWDSFLSSWPEEYYTGAMRTVTGTKRRMRQVIAEEYNRWAGIHHSPFSAPDCSRFGRNDNAFLAAWGTFAARGFSHLAKAIANQHGAHRTSKNGTHQERSHH